MKSKDTNSEARYAGTDWDACASVSFRKNRQTMDRKVLTNGVREIDVGGETMSEIRKLLRQGFEVRLNDAIRLYPCLKTDYKTMFVCAQTIDDFRDLLKDKHAKLVYRGYEIRADEADVNGKRHFSEPKEAIDEITPDTMVKCPKCGHKFRVGKKNAA